MIEFPNNYPFKITNETASELCGIAAGSTLTIGQEHMADTMILYNTYANDVITNLTSGNLSASRLDDTLIDSNIAASEFSNLISKIHYSQNIHSYYIDNININKSFKLNPVTTVERNSLIPSSGMQIINADTGKHEVYDGSEWVEEVGAQGPQGIVGDTGPQGNQGNNGVPGDQGPQGAPGNDGSQGSQGDQGVVGPQGNQGVSGNIGPQGNQGPQGSEPDTSNFISNVSGAQQVSAIEVVTALPGTQSASTLYFVLE